MLNLSQASRIFEKAGLLLKGASADLTLESLSCDSRFVGENSLFFTKGVHFKEEYLLQAEKKGACAYVAEQEYPASSLPFLLVRDLRLAMPLLAKEFYGNPASRYPLVGVTGTKGKTTVAYLLKSIFTEAFGAEKVGIISTNEALCGSMPLKKNGTTPEALELYGILNTFAESGVKAAVMEVSSQGLQYNRVEYVPFDTGIFLNLSPDHVSPTEHHSFEEYKEAKKRMLTLCRRGIVNLDDRYAEEIIRSASCPELYTLSLKDHTADFFAEDILLSKRGVSFRVSGNLYNLHMPGEFNVYNALAAIATATLLGVSPEVIARGLEKTSIAGRMEILEKNGVTVIVDYAHNALSFQGVFDYINSFYPDSRILCLFGCQGNKALDRRRDLPEIAGKRADVLILTADDPAFEEVDAILDEMESHLPPSASDVYRISDREEAVRFALSLAKTGDVVFLAGKGHEKTQIVAGKTVPFKGDMPCAEEFFAAVPVENKTEKVMK